MRLAAAALVASSVLSLAGVAGCRRGDREIRAGFEAAFDAPPVLAVADCPDGDAKLERLGPLFGLALRAYKQVPRLDQPLPADLAADLLATPITGYVSDYRCFLSDGRSREVAMGTIANLYLRKGEALLARGDSDAGWAHVVEGLSVYAQPQGVAFIMYLGTGYFFGRIETLLARYPAPPAVLDRLAAVAGDSLLPRATFCAGLRLEQLNQLYIAFFDRLAPFRARAAARWGERNTTAVAEINDNRHSDLALWRGADALYTPFFAGCADDGRPLAPLEKAARAALAAVPRPSAVADLAPYTLDRLPQYGDLADASLVFAVDVGRRRLAAGGGKPPDAAAVRARVLAPGGLASPWDGSAPSIEDDPAAPGGLVVARGKLRRVLPPLVTR
jgi:hypothetical protein